MMVKSRPQEEGLKKPHIEQGVGEHIEMITVNGDVQVGWGEGVGR